MMSKMIKPEVELATWLIVPQFIDSKGKLSTIEFDSLPFTPARCFTITGVPKKAERGGHAHLTGEQLLVCVEGRILVELRLNGQVENVICEPNGQALLIKQGIWSKQVYLEPESSLLVLCSQSHAATKYSDEGGHSSK